ncbi:MAG: MFS transporter [Bacillota bacterium]
MQIKKSNLQQQEQFYSTPLNWVFFFGSVFFFMVNLFAAISVFPGYSLAIGASPFLAGLQNTVFGVAAVLLRFFLGPLMDKKGPRPLMLVGTFAFATTPLLLILSPSYAMLVTARIYQSIGLAVYLPGVSTLAAEMAPKDKIGTYLGASRIFFNLGLLAGPSGALLIIDHYGYTNWFIVSALTSAFALVFLLVVKTPAAKTRADQVITSLGQITRALAEKQVYPVMAGIAIYSFTYSGVVSFAAVHIETAAPGIEAAYFFVIHGIAGIIGCLGAGALSDRFGRKKVAWPILTAVGVGAAAFYFLPFWPALAVICGIILGLGIQGSSLVFAAWLIDVSKPELRATTISLQENTIDIFFALSALFFGAAAQGPGLGSAFLISGILTIAAVFPLSRKTAKIIARQNQ